MRGGAAPHQRYFGYQQQYFGVSRRGRRTPDRTQETEHTSGCSCRKEEKVRIPEGKRFSTMLGGRELVLETGKYAKLVSGSVLVRYGECVALVTAHMSDGKSPMDFLPLTVEYEERHYAIGKIPGSFMRREGRPGTQATINARITDRQIRPLLPTALRHEIQVIDTNLSADQQKDPAQIAALGE